MIDTHCHLTDRRLTGDVEGALLRAAAAGVGAMVTIASDVGDSRRCVELCRGRAQVRCAVGIHPHVAAESGPDDIAALRALQRDPSVVALGEMGLDYHYEFSPRQRQREVFEAQLDLVGETGRPVVIHCREALDDCLAILRGRPPMRAVFHCFTGTAKEARRIVEAGYLLGFTGILTFGKSEELRRIAAEAPSDRIVVETDAPYLAPEPFRKRKVNEPALVVHVAAELARVRGVPLAEIDRITTGNARGLYGWPPVA